MRPDPRDLFSLTAPGSRASLASDHRWIFSWADRPPLNIFNVALAIETTLLLCLAELVAPWFVWPAAVSGVAIGIVIASTAGQTERASQDVLGQSLQSHRVAWRQIDAVVDAKPGSPALIKSSNLRLQPDSFSTGYELP